MDEVASRVIEEHKSKSQSNKVILDVSAGNFTIETKTPIQMENLLLISLCIFPRDSILEVSVSSSKTHFIFKSKFGHMPWNRSSNRRLSRYQTFGPSSIESQFLVFDQFQIEFSHTLGHRSTKRK